MPEPRPLLDDAALHRSSVVANNAMNRERGLTGVNSYARELGFDPAQRIAKLAAQRSAAAWLDLCCGSGRALFEAAAAIESGALADRITLVGVDLVDFFVSARRPPGLSLIAQPVADFRPRRRFDLITCVHGLHYVGDKLGVIEAASSWLTPGGAFTAHFDPQLLRHPDGNPAARKVLSLLRSAGARYDARARRLSVDAPMTGLTDAMRYLGADDAVGPGCTGQPAVASYYAFNGDR